MTTSPTPREQLEALLPRVLKDGAGKLSPEDLSAFLDQAIVQIYSKDRALEKVSDVAGDGSHDLALPTGWQPEFSLVRTIEFPIGDVPPTLVEESDWAFYRTPSTTKLRLLAATPSASDQVRLTWTQRHLADGSTLPVADYEAIIDLAASLCCDALARVYAQTGDNVLGADVVNYRTKSQEWTALAKRLRQNYASHMGISASGDGAAQAGPAIAFGDVDETMGFGGDRLTHGRPR